MKNKYIIFDIGGTFIKYAVVDSDYKILLKDKFPFDAINENCKVKMIKLIGEKAIELKKDYENVVGIGVSTAGDVDPNTTTIIGSVPNHKNYKGVNFKKELSKYIDLPLVIDNDANIAVLGEFVKGQLKNTKNSAMITLGTDIGCGIIINEEVFKSNSGCAANAGYMNVLDRRFGTYFSAIGLKRLLKEFKNIEEKPQDILPNKKYSEVVDYWYKGLSIGIANIIAILSPEKLIIGGGLSESKMIDIKKIKKIVSSVLIEKHIINSCKIELSNNGNESALYGCVKLLNIMLNVK